MREKLLSDDLGLSQRHLWLFANTFYANKAVEEALLQAQNEHDADVCILLFLIWHCCDLDAQSEVLNKDDLPKIVSQIEAWRSELIQPLRQLRKSLKTLQSDQNDTLNTKPFIEEIKTLELKAEKAQLVFLAGLHKKSNESLMSNGINDVAINEQKLQDIVKSYKGQIVADLISSMTGFAMRAYEESLKQLT